jgi:hypothetical protein
MSKVERVEGNVSTDLYANVEDCEKDDYLKFDSDFTINQNGGNTLCDVNQPQESFGRWNLMSDIELEVLEGVKITIYTIKELEKGLMVLTTVEEEGVRQLTFYAK